MSYIGIGPEFAVMKKESFTGDGSTTEFTLTHRPGKAEALWVVLDGVVQEPKEDYTVSGYTLTFDEAPDDGLEFFVLYRGFEVNRSSMGDGILYDALSSADPDTLALRDSSGRVKSSSGGNGKDSVVWDDTGTEKDKLPTSGQLGTSYVAMPIGVPFPVWDHLSGIDAPDNSGEIKFIRLTAGEDGSGEYNEGLLKNESVSGSAPLIEATADIDYEDSPINGDTVYLVNTEGRYLKPGESSGDVANDQMQQITGGIDLDGSRNWDRLQGQTEGAFSQIEATAGQSTNDVTTDDRPQRAEFDSANSPDARTGDHTDVKHIVATYYMRIA